MIDFTGYKLGAKQGYSKSESKRLMLAAYLPPDLPEPPVAVDYTGGLTTLPEYDNNRIGDCTCCAIANIITNNLAVAYNKHRIFATEDVVNLYKNFGYNPLAVDQNGNNPTDGGAVVEDVINYVLKNGFMKHHFIGSAAVNPQNIVAVKRAIDLYGAIDIAIALPLIWQTSNVWYMPPNPNITKQTLRGSWGGHCIMSAKYDEQYLYVWSWGKLFAVEWAAFQFYVESVDVIISASWIKENVSPKKVDLTNLVTDLALLRG